MTPTYDLLLLITLLLSLIIYAYVEFESEVGFNFAYADHQKANLNNTHNLNDVSPYVSVNNEDAFIDTQNKMELIKPEINIETELKLKKYYQQLRRSLKTLTYISLMEADASNSKDRLKALLNLKENVQHEVIRITRQINFYKSQNEDAIAA